MRSTRLLFMAMLILLFVSPSAAQVQNGKLQIHHIDVGQADGAVLISPKGEVVLFDLGEDMKRKSCREAVAYLDQLGVTTINYVFVSHYHFDHIGCIPAALKQFPLAADALVYDRGSDYNGATFNAYVNAVSTHRKEAKVGDLVVLDENSDNPVKIEVFVVDGRSAHATVATNNENDLSLGALISFAKFREVMSGDLSGDETDMYQDVETPAAPDVGEIDVYKVHHHCSSHSTNGTWLDATKPTVAVISTGNGNPYGHPAADCVTRLHEGGIEKVYWTEEGAGQAKFNPDLDIIAGDVQIEVAPKAPSYTVAFKGSAPVEYTIKGASQPAPKYAWSKRSSKYHDASCPDVSRILPANLVSSDTPPADKTPAACVKEH